MWELSWYDPVNLKDSKPTQMIGKKYGLTYKIQYDFFCNIKTMTYLNDSNFVI